METIDFLIPDGGGKSYPGPTTKVVCIKIPAVCCGTKTIITKCGPYPQFDSIDTRSCRTHLNGWNLCWVHFGPNGQSLHLLEDSESIVEQPIATGHFCANCNLMNEFAKANQDNGSYICYECR